MRQALIVHLQLNDGGFGSLEERGGILALQDQMVAAIGDANVGEFDGDLWGGRTEKGTCMFSLDRK